MKIKNLPKSLKAGGTILPHALNHHILPLPDGVHRINDTCIELETYSNLTRSGSAMFIGLSALLSLIFLVVVAIFVSTDSKVLLIALAWSPLTPCIALAMYFASGAHRCRGAYIRINRITRKLYFIYPNNQKHMHIIDWDKIEAMAGFIPIVSSYGYSSRHPLYLFAIDYRMSPPTEICAACGNLSALDNGRSARALWEYLQRFMSDGIQNLPLPPKRAEKLSRLDSTIQPYREWVKDIQENHSKTRAWLWSPLTIPLAIFLLLFYTYPNSVEAWIQYNVPYVKFPHENDVLCGFAEKRKPVIRVNGVKTGD
ncbi:hypothetical protein F3J44_09585 [Pantoea sp. Tr-811]|uniref:DUF6708 domain-containing protein n=1 Tax=Pantoea sp. Tr-811 TaxID=2608361 RepID=UPI0014224920|nr:DUF6708 domain-containing protein [Pantoea sp. Tr-811]NIF26638.1 hypothetical protein [Pantoea sp. Tr-811]